MLATYRKLEQEAERLTEASQATNDPSSSKKKRARDSRKLLARVKAALDEGRIEEDIRGVKLEKVFSPASTKQSMVARVSSLRLPYSFPSLTSYSLLPFSPSTSIAPSTTAATPQKTTAT